MLKLYYISRDLPDYKLSANFKLKEFQCSDGNDIVVVDTDLVYLLEIIRAHFGRPVVIDSAYRTIAYNRTIKKASPTSQHIEGRAADIRIKDVSPADVAAFARQLMPNFGGVGTYSSFTHIDTRHTVSNWKG